MSRQGQERVLLDFQKNCDKYLSPVKDLRVSGFNILKVLGVANFEIRHSNIIAWLLDAKESHGLGGAFATALFRKLSSRQDNTTFVSDGRLFMPNSFRDFKVDREVTQDNGLMPDIVMTSEADKTVICIENKVDAKEGATQLQDYRAILTDPSGSYGAYTKKMFIFLTPTGRRSERDGDNWATLSYSDIVAAIAESLQGATSLNEDVKVLLKHYITNAKSIVRRNKVTKAEEGRVCREIYAQHRDVFDMIFEHKDEAADRVKDIVRAALTERAKSGDIIHSEDEQFDPYAKFRTKEMDAKLPPLGKGKGAWGRDKNGNERGDERGSAYWYWLEVVDGDDGRYIMARFEVSRWDIPASTETVMQKLFRVGEPAQRVDSNQYRRFKAARYDLDSDDENYIRGKVNEAVDGLLAWQENVLPQL